MNNEWFLSAPILTPELQNQLEVILYEYSLILQAIIHDCNAYRKIYSSYIKEKNE